MVDRFFSLITVRTSIRMRKPTDHELPTIKRIYIFLEPRFSKF